MTCAHACARPAIKRRSQAAAVCRSGSLTVCAVAVGFTVVLFAPRFYTPQRTAALPTFKDTGNREQPGAPVQIVAAGDCAGNPARYAGKSVEDIAKIARFSSARRGPRPGPTGIRFPERATLHCLLTEAPARYCAPIQRSKITAAIIDHFRIVEHAAKVAKIEVEPRILVAIEGLIRAGYLLKPQREDIASILPREIKERFARVVGNKPPCPETPWWQVWK